MTCPKKQPQPCPTLYPSIVWPDTLQTKWSIKGNKTVTIVKWRNVKGIIQSRKIFMRQKAIPCIVKINGVMYHYCLILSFYEKLPFFNQTIKKEIENYVARKWVCAHKYSKEKRIILVNNDINQQKLWVNWKQNNKLC